MFFVDYVFPKGSSLGVLLKRLITSVLVVFLTYNIWGQSFYHWWPLEGMGNARILFLWAAITIVWIAVFIMSFKGFGKLGIVGMLIFFAGLVYLAVQEGWVSREDPSSSVVFGQILLVIFFTGGKSIAILWKKATGQYKTDEAEDI